MRAGSWGAIHGANKANTTKMATRITPIVASQLRLAVRVSLAASGNVASAADAI
jgi:hypothetical protein